MPRRQRIRDRNDAFRTTLKSGSVLMTPAVWDLPAQVRGKVLWRIANYTAFDKDGYHDAGVIIFGDWSFYWRIEDRPTGIVLILMLAEDLADA